MGSTVKDLKAFDVEQMAIIGKMHGMQWLKSNSLSSGHTKKTHPDAKEVIIDCSLKSQINEGTAESTKVVSTGSISSSPQLRDNDPGANKDIDNGGSVTDPIRSGLTVVDSSQRDMETVWNKDVNVTSTLFPNSQSLVAQRLDEQTSASMSLTENIVTAQLEQFRLNEGGKDKIDESHNEGVNEWSTVHNAPGSPKSDADVGDQVSSEQCHDNNNNNAKSKAQPTSELKRSMQKIATKISIRKASDQSVRKQAGCSLKESCAVSKQGSKDKDESLDSSIIDNKTSTPAADSKRISAGITPKLSDKCGKFNGHNRQLITGRGSQTKEQQIFKQHFSTLNDSGNRSKLAAEGSDDRSKSCATKLRSSRCESDKKSNEIVETKCHKVQVTRTQSYNVQYNANKASIKSQQRYLRNTTRVEEENSVKHTSGFNSNINVSSPAETVLKKKCDNPQTAVNKQFSDTRFSQSGSAIVSKDFNVPESGTNERNLTKASNSSQCKKSYQNLSIGKASADRNVKDDQGSAQKFKKNISSYRCSTGAPQTFSKDFHGKVRTDDYKKTVADNNPAKDFKVTRPCSVDTKARAPPEGPRITVYPHKTVNGASNTNKTDTSGSSSVNNVQSVMSLNSCSNSTKDSTAVDTSTRPSQEPQILQAACHGTEVQLVKTEQEDTCINNSNNKAASINTETGSVTYPENVQEVNMVDNSALSYIDNSVQQVKLSSDQLYSDLQGASNIANAQQLENHQGVHNKSYFNQNNAQYSNMSASIQNPERDLYLLDVAQQKPEQATHVSQSIPSHSNCNPAISMGNGVPYQDMSAVYLNQYTNAQTVPRKTADTSIVSHSSMVPPTPSYTMESQNMMQSEPTSILMHNSQTSVLPPPGFHNHPVSSQHSQWSLPLPDMYLYGNLMNPTSPLNMQIPNSRQLCNADYNSIQQAGYLQHPLFYVPQMCMQGWNPLLQYPAALFQNPPYSNCGAYPNQVLPQNSMADTMSCTVPTSVQSNNPFKQFLQLQQLESNQGFSVPSAKLDSYPGNVHAGKASSSARIKGGCMNARSGQYRSPMSSEYQNCTQDAQVTSPYSYAVAMDSIARNSPSSLHMQASQKYPSRALTAANYQRMPDACTAYQSRQDTGRKDDIPKVDSECMPPMVSPRDCMYYGVNYSRNTDTVQSLPVRAAAKPVAYTHPVNSQHYNQHYQRLATQQTLRNELTSRAPIGRGIRKSMEQ